MPQPDVAGAGARSDEGRALPRQRARFIVRQRCFDRQNDRSHLWRRPQAQIDPRYVAVGRPLLQDLDQPPADAHRSLASIIAFALRQPRRIEQQKEVDIRRIIELTTAELAHGDHRKPSRVGARYPLGDGSADRTVDRTVGKVGQKARDLFERKLSGEVAERDRKRELAPLLPKLALEPVAGSRKRQLGRWTGALRFEASFDLRIGTQGFA